MSIYLIIKRIKNKKNLIFQINNIRIIHNKQANKTNKKQTKNKQKQTKTNKNSVRKRRNNGSYPECC